MISPDTKSPGDQTHGADGKRRVKDGGSMFKVVAAVKARALAKVDVIDALTHATANLAADRTSDQAAKGCAQEGAKETASRASNKRLGFCISKFLD